MRSIRVYLLTRLLGGAALILAVAGASVFLMVTRYLENRFDENLGARVQGFASILFQLEDEVEFEFSDQLMPEYDQASTASYFQLWYRDGRLIERSNSLGAGDLEVPIEAGFEPRHWTAALPDGRSGRYVAQLIEVHHVYPEEGPDRPEAATVLVAIADGREGLLATRRTVLLECALTFLVLMALIGGLAWTAVRRGLGPAERLAAAVDAIDVGRLPERLDVGALPSELRSMAERTDQLLKRIAAALERERRTTADIAHELRTPISEMLIASEVALHDDTEPEVARETLRTVRDIAWRMGRSVATLLKLARLEMGAETFAHDDVDLGGIVSETLRSLAALEGERRLRVVNRVEDVDVVTGDGDVLRIVTANLLSNALYYSPRGGAIECRLERPMNGDGHGWRLCIENEAPELRPADIDVLAEPFWRKDRAREDRDHSGLGLALSRALAGRSGLVLEFRLTDGIFEAELSEKGGGGEPRYDRPAREGAPRPGLERHSA